MNKKSKKKKSKKQQVIDYIKNFDFKKFILMIKDNIINYTKYNIQFISYTILCLISCMLIRHYTIGYMFNIYSTLFDFSMIILIGSFAYFIRPKKQFYYFLSVMLIITIMNLINSIYFAFFNSYVSFGLLESLGQTAEVTDAVFSKLGPSNFVYLIMPIVFIIINIFLSKKDYFNIVEKIESGKRLFVGVAIVGGITLFINISMLTGTDISRFSKQWNREYIVQRFGIIVYQGNDLTQTLRSKLASMFGYEEAAKRFIEYYEENPYKESKNEYTGIFKGYNVIGIHMESIMSFLIGMEINGQEITPNLNNLIEESMYFDNFYPQVSAGTSSDTEFTFATSLMPVQIGTVSVSYYNRTYETVQKLLADKNYYTFSMHANKASMWNRTKMHKSLGYMDFYSEEYYKIDEVIGLGLSDSSFFSQSEEIIKQISDMVKEKDEYNNYMGNLITLSNHTPFDIDKYVDEETLFDVTYHTGKYNNHGEEIIYDYLKGKSIGKFIQSAHYADQCLGEFINYVKQHDEYKKTLFVLYGDHAAQLSKKEYAYLVNYDFDTGEQKTEDNPTYVNYDYYANELFKNTPLILWTVDKKIKGKVSYPMGMIDVLPTIANMLNIQPKYALGHDIFEIKNKNIVVFPNGNFLTNKVYYYNSKNEAKIFGTDETLEDNYIEDRKKYTETILGLSNDIIVYNLIEKAANRIGEGENHDKK